VRQLTPSNWPSFAPLPCDLYDDATCTTCCRSITSFEAKLRTSRLTCFKMKQAARCQCVSSHHLHPLIGFEAQTDKPPPTWFWGPNQETVVVILRPKSPNRHPWFWGPIQETLTVVLRPNHWQTITISFEAKPSGHRVPDLCLIIPDPPHQVCYSCLNPCHCPPCCIRHLHIMRQANTFLHTE
jgi:hypothetical protein